MTLNLYYFHAGFEAGVTYYFRISPKQSHDDNNVEWKSFVYPEDNINMTLTLSSIHKSQKDDTKPTAPYFVDVINVTSTTIDLTWMDNNIGEKYYDVCYFESKEDFNDCNNNGKIINT